MQILDFSKNRGIHAIFNGYGKQAYVFHSSYYGFCGYADIDETLCGEKSVVIDVYLCNGSKGWYWSLKDIVLRGIRKNEKQFIDKEIKFNIHWLDRFSGETPAFDGTIGNPNARFTIELYENVKEV